MRKGEIKIIPFVFIDVGGYSSVVEHSTADREVPGSIPGAPSSFFFPNLKKFIKKKSIIKSN